MAFWKRRKESADAAEEGLLPQEAGDGASAAEAAASAEAAPSAADVDASLGSILEALGAMVRVVGEYPFETADMDLDRVTAICESWARHTLVGAPSPLDTPHQSNDDDEPPAPTTYGLVQRRWRDVRRFFVHHRRGEHRQVNKVQEELKAMIWNFASRLRGVVAEDGGRDSAVTTELGELSDVARNGSLEQLRAKVASTVTVVSRAISARQQQYENHLQALGEQLSAIREDLLETRRQMEHDPLTGLYNRGAFDSALEHYVNLSFFSGQPLALILVDLDHFKAVNDDYGHRAGDAVLREVADQVLRCFPRRNDFVARYGGEEIAVLLLDTDLQNVECLAERMIEAVRQVGCAHDGQQIAITCSAGYAVLRRLEESQALLERADRALYRAKDGGRDRALAA